MQAADDTLNFAQKNKSRGYHCTHVRHSASYIYLLSKSNGRVGSSSITESMTITLIVAEGD